MQDWTLIENSSGEAPINLVSTSHDQLTVAETGVTHVYTTFGITPTPTFSSNNAFLPIASFTATGTETETFWFHPDHLGSSNYITNFVGEVSQHMEYFAFGESFVEEHKNSHNSPFLYNGKEFDSESGYTYYGARYLDMRYSLWLSVDKPLIDGKYLNFEHDGGVLNSYNLNSYAYCRQSPVVLIDPDGNQYNNSVLLIPVSVNRVAHAHGMAISYQETYYKFTDAAAHLLNLVSGVNKQNIKNAKVNFIQVPIGGGGLTEGSSSSNATINVFHKKPKGPRYDTNAGWLFGFLKLMAHEVGHIPQIDRAGSNIEHLSGSIWEYIKNWNVLRDSHDPLYAHKETEAEKGNIMFEQFSDFLDTNYGKKGGTKGDVLKQLFNNKYNTQKTIIRRINQWWKKFQKTL